MTAIPLGRVVSLRGASATQDSGRFEQRSTVRRVREFSPPISAATLPFELLMTESGGTDGYEVADLINSFHWVSKSEIFSVVLLPAVQALAIPVAPLGLGFGILAVPPGDLGFL